MIPDSPSVQRMSNDERHAEPQGPDRNDSEDREAHVLDIGSGRRNRRNQEGEEGERKEPRTKDDEQPDADHVVRRTDRRRVMMDRFTRLAVAFPAIETMVERAPDHPPCASAGETKETPSTLDRHGRPSPTTQISLVRLPTLTGESSYSAPYMDSCGTHERRRDRRSRADANRPARRLPERL